MHPYLDHKDGWETIAGQDIEIERKAARVILVTKKKTKATAILMAKPMGMDWSTFAEGSTEEVLRKWNLFDRS